MNYILVREGIVANIIVCNDSEIVESLGLKPFYPTARIGEKYDPPFDCRPQSEQINSLKNENALLKAQLQAQTERSDFIEDCIAEMAMQVYAE